MNKVYTLIVLLFSTLCLHAQRNVYNHYAAQDDLFVAYAHDYALDSTNRLDAIVVQAKDSMAWQRLKCDFNISELSEIQKKTLMQQGRDVRFSYLSDCNDSSKTDNNAVGLEKTCVVVGSHRDKTLCVFYIENDEQLQILIHNQLKLIKNQQP